MAIYSDSSDPQQADYGDDNDDNHQHGLYGVQPVGDPSAGGTNLPVAAPTEAHSAYRPYNPQSADDVHGDAEPLSQQPTVPLRAPPVFGPPSIQARQPEAPRPVKPGTMSSGGGASEGNPPTGPLALPLAPGRSITLGRAPDNVIILDSPLVAAHHAALAHSGDDLATLTIYNTEHTWLDGFPVRTDRLSLAPGAELRIGPYDFIFTGARLEQFDESRDIQIDAVDLRKEVRTGAFHHSAKTLLDNISLSIPPGSLVALIGASGVGKTTLLHTLSGHDPAHSGAVLYNGEDVYAHLAAYSASLGYVPQDDIIHKNLSVERALFYAARLRLPRDKRRREIQQRVEETLQDIDLVGQRHQRISQLSGGERKRVNIGVELLARPAVFFLDEPTSGLDAGLDRAIMDLLRRLADRGHTVVLTTHLVSHLSVCDFICFLAPGGRLAYYGPPDELRHHFQLDGFDEIYTALAAAPERWVAAFRQSPDYMRYVVQPRVQAANRGQAAAIALREQREEQDAGAPAQAQRITPRIDQIDGTPTQPAPAIPAMAPISGPLGTPDDSWKIRAARQRTQLSGGWRQFRLLTMRYLELMAHDPANLLILLAQAPIIALLITLLSRGNDIHIVATGSVTPYPLDMYAQRTLFIMVCSAVWFGTINAAREIVKEKPVYTRERTIHLGILPYIFSKIVVLMLLSAIQDAILLAIVGHKSGYPPNGLFWPQMTGSFVELYLSLLLLSLVGVMMGLLVSALAPNTDRAISFVPILLIPQIIFANVVFTLSGAGEYVSYIIPARWGMQAMGSIDRLRNQFTDHGSHPFFDASRAHVIGFWLALVALALIFFACAAYFQRRKDLAH